jgi:hypothetical protein
LIFKLNKDEYEALKCYESFVSVIGDIFIRRNEYKVISHFVLNTADQIYVNTLSLRNKKEYLALEVSAYYEHITKLVTNAVITQAPIQILLGEYLIIILLAKSF